MEPYEIFKDMAIILVAAKLFGILARKLNVPQVVGEIIAGLLIGPSVFGFVKQSEFLNYMGEIGVIMLMFSAGLGASLKDLKKTGIKAFAIALLGVLVPLVCGALLYMCVYGFAAVGTTGFYKALFIGTIFTATSVGITVETLSEMGKLKTPLGTTLVSAAIIDDIIGIIVLAVVIGVSSGGANSNVSAVLIRNFLFVLVSGIGGFIFYKIFKKLDNKYTHKQRIAIFGLALCMFLAYCSERYFGVADITGAFVAGVILCNIRDAKYIERKLSINSYMLFGPIFFAGIGIKTNIQSISSSMFIFSIFFVLVALIAKIIGCGGISKMMKYSWRDSLKIGVGMMARGEVALIVAQKGLDAGLLEAEYFAPVIILIITSSIITPILLKVLYKNEPAVNEL